MTRPSLGFVILGAVFGVGFLWAGVARATSVFTMPGGDTSMVFVPVGDPGNAPDVDMGDGARGAVAYKYAIGEYDVTAGQYTQFLNAVAKTDPYGVYNTNMGAATFASGGNVLTLGCGITRTGSSGSYSYTVSTTTANFPVNDVTWGSAARFANWLTNGQPTTGAENASTTETGSYALNGATSNVALMAITRSTSAVYALPTPDEWYKAAYYKGGGTNAGYNLYPTNSSTAPLNTLPDPGDHANFYDYEHTGNGGFTDSSNYLTSVGAFSKSASAYGTFDQGGDVGQWNEGVYPSQRGVRGGTFSSDVSVLSSDGFYSQFPITADLGIGFRLVLVPEPASLGMVGLAGVPLLMRRRRGHGPTGR